MNINIGSLMIFLPDLNTNSYKGFVKGNTKYQYYLQISKYPFKSDLRPVLGRILNLKL